MRGRRRSIRSALWRSAQVSRPYTVRAQATPVVVGAVPCRNVSAGRLRRRFYNVWCGEGRQLVEWEEDMDVDGQVQGNVRERRRVRILISESFPVCIRGDRLLHDDMG